MAEFEKASDMLNFIKREIERLALMTWDPVPTDITWDRARAGASWYRLATIAENFTMEVSISTINK
jgi:hypothetical protein